MVRPSSSGKANPLTIFTSSSRGKSTSTGGIWVPSPCSSAAPGRLQESSLIRGWSPGQERALARATSGSLISTRTNSLRCFSQSLPWLSAVCRSCSTGCGILPVPINRQKSLPHWETWRPVSLTNSTIRLLQPSELPRAWHRPSTEIRSCAVWGECSPQRKNYRITWRGREFHWR